MTGGLAGSVGRYALYRYFDSTDRLLYVGMSGELGARLRRHVARSVWMEFAARSTIERYSTPEELTEAERATIEAERPVFNREYNDTPEAQERRRAYLAEAGRLDLLAPLQRAMGVRAPHAKPSPPAFRGDAVPSSEEGDDRGEPEAGIAAPEPPASGATTGWARLVYRHAPTAIIRAARQVLGMDCDEFASYLSGAVGWQVRESVVAAWEEGVGSPSEVMLACAVVIREALVIAPAFPLRAEARIGLKLVADGLTEIDEDDVQYARQALTLSRP